jgi:hypothetical protein
MKIEVKGGRWPRNVVVLFEKSSVMEGIVFKTQKVEARGSFKSWDKPRPFWNENMDPLNKKSDQANNLKNVKFELRKEGLAVVFPADFFVGKESVLIYWNVWFTK